MSELQTLLKAVEEQHKNNGATSFNSHDWDDIRQLDSVTQAYRFAVGDKTGGRNIADNRPYLEYYQVDGYDFDVIYGHNGWSYILETVDSNSMSLATDVVAEMAVREKTELDADSVTIHAEGYPLGLDVVESVLDDYDGLQLER